MKSSLQYNLHRNPSAEIIMEGSKNFSQFKPLTTTPNCFDNKQSLEYGLGLQIIKLRTGGDNNILKPNRIKPSSKNANRLKINVGEISTRIRENTAMIDKAKLPKTLNRTSSN